jgi:hypothetical protein
MCSWIVSQALSPKSIFKTPGQVIKAEPVVFLGVKAYGAVVAAQNDVPGEPPARLSRPAWALLEINLILLSTDTIQHARKIVVGPLLFFIKQRLKEERIPKRRCAVAAARLLIPSISVFTICQRSMELAPAGHVGDSTRWPRSFAAAANRSS